MNLAARRIGAVCYLLWGVMHVMIGAMLLRGLAAGGPASYVSAMDPDATLPGPLPGLLSGTLAQNAWNLLWFGAVAAVVAVRLNWRNDRAGYWINLVLVSLADLGFVGAILVPGYMRSLEAFLGPLLWIGGALFTTLAVLP